MHLAVPATGSAVVDDLVLDDTLAVVVPAIVTRVMTAVAAVVVVVIAEIVVVARVLALPLNLANAFLASLADLVGKLDATKNILLFDGLVIGSASTSPFRGKLT